MKITLINGSPRRDKASSRVVIDTLAARLAGSPAAPKVPSASLPATRKPAASLPAAGAGQNHSLVSDPVLQASGSTKAEFILIDAYSSRLPESGDLDAEVLVLAFPLYVDSLPARLLSWLVEIQPVLEAAKSARLARGLHPQGLACIANCGFHEGEQNKSALDILWHFSRSVGLDWITGLGIGTGEMVRELKGAPPDMFIKRPVTAALGEVAGKIESFLEGRGPVSGAPVPSAAPGIPTHKYTRHAFPRFLYILAGHAGWKAQARENGLHPREIRRRPLPVS